MKKYIKAMSIDPTVAIKIQNAAYGEDAMKAVLNYLKHKYPNKIDGYEYDGSGFDVSFQGDYDELEQLITNIYTAAGINITDGYQWNASMYDNDGQEVEIIINEGNDDFTFTPESNGFYISVHNLYE